MSTNSLIGIKNQNGTVEAIYCHWDGHPSHVGKILKNHYQNERKVKELLALGDVSSLAENVHPPKHKEHTLDNPMPDVTVAYHRDRNEPLGKPFEYENVEEYLNNKDYPFLYLYDAGDWYCHDGSRLYEL